MTPKERAARIIPLLCKQFPKPKSALDYSTPLELLVATILSAQCTDVRVNMVTPALFNKYRSAKDYAHASPATFEQEIRSTGFFKNKTKNIIAAANAIRTLHKGTVPRTMEELITLPGVGRKTANCVLGAAFGVASGVVVDTHVIRLSQRLGLTTHKNPEKIEQDLIKILPQNQWVSFSHLLILHGRATCIARSPRCTECALNSLCPFGRKTPCTK